MRTSEIKMKIHNTILIIFCFDYNLFILPCVIWRIIRAYKAAGRSYWSSDLIKSARRWICLNKTLKILQHKHVKALEWLVESKYLISTPVLTFCHFTFQNQVICLSYKSAYSKLIWRKRDFTWLYMIQNNETNFHMHVTLFFISENMK